MVKKITISVPDELHKKMMDWKESFNFSQVFQEAISDLIQKKEGFQKRLKGGNDMEAIVERLKKEKVKSESNYFEQGKNDGLEFAKSADYDTLQYALQWETMREFQNYPISYSPQTDEILGDYFADVFNDDNSLIGFEETSYGNYIPNDFFIQWEAGWKEAIEAFWYEIEDRLTDGSVSCAYELDGEILCTRCFFEKIEKRKDINDDEHVITNDKWKLKFGSKTQAWCKECGVAIVYDEG